MPNGSLFIINKADTETACSLACELRSLLAVAVLAYILASANIISSVASHTQLSFLVPLWLWRGLHLDLLNL